MLRRPWRFPPLRRCLSTSQTINGRQFAIDDYTNTPQSVLDKLPKRLHTQRTHPIGILRSRIESHFPTFSSISAPSAIVTPAQNFDDLSFPVDHVGRAKSDSYYLNREWMLRTHTSAHEVETFASKKDRWLLTADVYRRDEIDASHYPVFHQMEGACLFDADASGRRVLEEQNAQMREQLAREDIIIADESGIDVPSNPLQSQHNPHLAKLVSDHLKYSLNGLMLSLFGGASSEPLRVRWIDAFFPFTSPSFEVEVFFNGKWLEILGSGVVLQGTLDRARVPNKIGWAFGLGLERIAMILFAIPDIRLFWSQDPRFHSQFADSKCAIFKPYSKFPACFKDVSFWLPENGQFFQENDMYDLVRDIAGDLVEDITKTDEFRKNDRTSMCYRINYRSMDRSLSNSEVNALQSRVVDVLSQRFQVEIR